MLVGAKTPDTTRTITLTLSEDQYMRLADAVRGRLDDLEHNDVDSDSLAAAGQLDRTWVLVHDAWYAAPDNPSSATA